MFFICFHQDLVAHVPNCDVHIDRGLASAVLCSSEPGLSIQSPDTKDWLLVRALPITFVDLFLTRRLPVRLFRLSRTFAPSKMLLCFHVTSCSM